MKFGGIGTKKSCRSHLYLAAWIVSVIVVGFAAESHGWGRGFDACARLDDMVDEKVAKRLRAAIEAEGKVGK